MEVAIGERQQREQRRAEHALGEGVHGRAVVCDPGRCELFVEQARVRLSRAEQQRRAFERDAVAQRVDEHAHCGAHFVVGIGSRHDFGGVGRVGVP